MKFKTQFNPKYKGTKSKLDFEKSMTIPDMAMSVRTMLERHTRGQGIKVAINEGQYFDEIIPQINDLTDLEERRQMLVNWDKEIKQQIEKEKQAALDKKQIDLEDSIKEVQNEKSKETAPKTKPS